MRRMIAGALGCVLLAMANAAWASPCVINSLAFYLALDGTGCEIQGAHFYDFELLEGPNGATDFGALTVVPVQQPGVVGFDFTVDATAGVGDFFDQLISFRATTLGAAFVGTSVLLTGSSTTGDAAVTAVQNACLGGVFASADGVSGCTGAQVDLIVVDIFGLADPPATALFAPVTSLAVVTDIGIDGGTDGASALSSAGTRLLLAPVSVPEPSTALLVLASLLAFVLAGRKAGGATLLRTMLAAGLAVAGAASASSHREAPIVAFDQKADITDVYAFRSYDGNPVPRVTFIMNVDPFLEPGNGPNWFPFDPDLLYEIRIDNNHDAVEDIVLQFRFTTEQRLPGLPQAYAGAGGGITAPANSPPPVPPGTLLIPPQVTSFTSIGLGQRQRYTVTLVKNGISTPILNSTGGPFYAVPANVGPRTMNYAALVAQGTYSAQTANVKVFAGTVDDPFFIDLGAAFDTLNLRAALSGGVLSPAQDAGLTNIASDTVSGYAVNTIAIELPVAMLTKSGAIEAAGSPLATIGIWATTSRPRTTVRRAPLPATSSGVYSQVQRLANPLVNELFIGTGDKDRWSMDVPKNDAQFSAYLLDPVLARLLNAATAGAIAIPAPPRNDLLPLVTYAPPIAAPGTPPGPVADLLRLNTGVAPTAPGFTSRLGLLGGDPAGYPNGRRLFDDVVDISLRVVAGVLAPGFNVVPNNRLGDGVNVNDVPFRTVFPYVADGPSGRDRRHIDPTEPGCTGGGGPACAP